MRALAAGLLVGFLLSLQLAEAALPKVKLEGDLAAPPVEPKIDLTAEQRVALYMRFCSMYQDQRRTEWLLTMQHNHLRAYQRWPSRKQEDWWRFVSHVVGCNF